VEKVSPLQSSPRRPLARPPCLSHSELHRASRVAACALAGVGELRRKPTIAGHPHDAPRANSPQHPQRRCVRAGSKHTPRRVGLHCQTRDAFHCFGLSSPRSPCCPHSVTSLWRTRVHLFHLTNGNS